MTRKLALVVAACLGLFHEAAWALGLGEITVESALNQPFEATIELRNTENLERNEIIANLASAEDFARVGVERFFFLSDLAFDTDLSDPRTPVLRVTSNQPVTEPFVNFVVEVLWPSGRLLKEFTILLDPPTYAARPLAAPRAPATSGSTRTTPSAATATATASAAPAPGTGTGSFVGETYGVTDRNDTLWDIALKVRPDDDLSVHQTMLALLRLNPEAFIGGNINQLKAGYVLRVPNAEEVRRLSRDDAVVQVAEQNDRWRAGLDRAPLDARESVAGARGANSSGGELRLVSGTRSAAASTGGTGTGTAAAPARASNAQGTNAPALRAELTAARTQLDEARRQNATLRGEMQGTSAEVEELQRELEVKNEQIARLQAAVAQQLEAESSAPSPAPAPRAPAAAGGLFGFSWMIIGGAVAGLVLLGVIILLVLRRLSSSSGDDDIAAFAEAEVERSIDETQLMPALTAEDLGGSDSTPDGDDAGEDVLAEADVYMAYGNFSEAAAALGAALESDPNRADIRLKLLEVHVEQGDVDAFNEQAFALQGIADEATVAEADRLAARLPGAASSTGEITSGDAPAPARESSDGAMSLDFDLAVDGDSGGDDDGGDLDSLDIDLDLGDGDDAAGDEGDDDSLDFGLDLDGDDAGDDLDLDDDLGLDIAGDEPAPKAAADAGDGAADDFELSLEGEADDDDGALPDIDFDLEKDDEEAAPAAPAAAAADDDEGDLDFDIDGLDGDDEGDAAPGVTSESADDFADRTVILGGDDLEAALETDGDEEDDDFSFDIDDLAEPGAPAASDSGTTDSGTTDSGTTDSGTSEPDLSEALGLDDDDGDLDFEGGFDFDDDASAEEATPAAADDEDDGTDATELLGADDESLDADLDFELDEEFDFSDEGDADEITTKLELARAYVDMGDEEGAKEILDEVVRDGDDGQKKEAGELLSQIG